MARRELIISLCVFIHMNIAKACWSSSNKNRCCDEIQRGFCFSRSGLFSADPECPSRYSPTFTLYTRTLRSGITLSKDNIPSSFSNDRRTVYIVHGWRGSFNSNYRSMKDALLTKDDLNVIAVDWRDGASSITYIPAAANTQSIGALIGAMTNALRTRSGSNPYFWCIGHSLGSHACGYSSLTAAPPLERITGVDPAGPSFGRDKGLTRNSAANVDVIHTDPVFGSIYPRGHVDFYPSGGRNQPGCALSATEQSVRNPDSDEERITAMQQAFRERGEIGCSHQRALFYMINSVKDTSCYVANQICTDYRDIPNSCTQIPSEQQYGVMGYDAINFRYDGYLHFEPGNTSPHCVPS